MARLAGLLAACGVLNPSGILAATSAADPPFLERAAELGLDFVHFNGMTGELYFPEMTGAGGALLDYDGDGDLDVYLVQGTLLGPGKRPEDALIPYQGPEPASDRLYRNDLGAAAGEGSVPRFVDVTAASGLMATGYGMGVAVGDADGDGEVDLYLTNYGSNQLWRNHGDGTFSDATRTAGVDDPGWSTGAAFVDYDGDEDLDLFVVNYVEFDLVANPRCFATSSRRDYCGPAAFTPVPDTLFRNRGDGTFEDVTLPAGLGAAAAGLGVTVTDLDGDGRVDLYVTNDGMANHFWRNEGGGTFVDDALFAGVAVNRQGRPEASMGVDAGDFDGDGDEDLFMTHLAGESNTLYVNQGGGLFEDRSIEAGLTAISLPYTAFGTAWVDYDLDGWLDLFVANGAVLIQEEEAQAGDPYPLKQPNQLLHNLGGKGFEDVSRTAGAALELVEVSRGAAFGDVDEDGDTDILVANNAGAVRLLVNQTSPGRPWIGIETAGPRGGPVLGSRVRLDRSPAPPQWRRVRVDGSYASANDARVVLGRGPLPPVSLEVYWPDGRRVRWMSPPTERYLLVRRSPLREKP